MGVGVTVGVFVHFQYRCAVFAPKHGKFSDADQYGMLHGGGRGAVLIPFHYYIIDS